MPLTRDFRVTIGERLARDPGFREALLEGGMRCFLRGEVDVGKSILRDYVNATARLPDPGDESIFGTLQGTQNRPANPG